VDSGLSAPGEGREFGTVRNGPKNEATALKEAFDQLWDYRHEGWARRFFENWRQSLKWQRLKLYERFTGATKNISASWSSPARFPRYDRLRSPTRSPEAPQK